MDSSHDLDEATFWYHVRNYEYYRGGLAEDFSITASGIHRAVIEADIDKIKRCLESGESINKKESQYGYTPLHLFMIGTPHGFQDENQCQIQYDDPYAYDKLLEFLLSHKELDLNTKCNQGETPLYIAVSFDQVELVEILIEAGADVNASDDENDTPLHMALQYRSPMCDLLLEHGAVIHKDDKWKNVLYNAQMYKRFKVVQMLSSTTQRRRKKNTIPGPANIKTFC